MSGGLGVSKQKAGSNQQFDQNVWGPQGDALQNLYSQMGSLFSQSNQGMQGQIPGAVDWSNDVQQDALNPWKQQMQGGAYADMGIQNQLMGSLTQSMNTPSATSEINAMTMGGEGNNYADAMKGQYMQDADRAQKQMLSNTDARAAASGMSGGSRHGIAQAKGMEQINDNLMSNMANTGYQTFDKDLQRKLDIAGQADTANLDRQKMLQQMLGSQQSAMTGGINNASNMQNLGMGGMDAYMAPWQAAGAYTNAIGGPTVLGSGSGSSNSSAKGASGSGSSKG